jgi:hypothetical protein
MAFERPFMLMTLSAFLVAVLLLLQTRPAPAGRSMQADVDRLIGAAEELRKTWPSQPPPPIAEVSDVARHGKAVVPILMALLSNDRNAERDRKRWKVQQQAALALCRIYSESQHCQTCQFWRPNDCRRGRQTRDRDNLPTTLSGRRHKTN